MLGGAEGGFSVVHSEEEEEEIAATVLGLLNYIGGFFGAVHLSTRFDPADNGCEE